MFEMIGMLVVGLAVIAIAIALLVLVIKVALVLLPVALFVGAICLFGLFFCPQFRILLPGAAVTGFFPQMAVRSF